MKNILFISLLMLLAVSQASPAACEDMSEEQQKFINIQTQLAKEKIKLKAARVEEQKALSSLYLIKRNLQRAQKSLYEAKGRMTYNENKMVELKSEQEDAKKKIKQKSEMLRSRAVEIYKSGGGNFLDILFASRSMADFINRTYYFSRLINRDAQLIGDVRQQVETMKRTRAQLASANKEIKGSVKTIEIEKTEITRATSEKQRVYQLLKVRRMEYERRVKQLEATSLEIEKFIRGRGTSKAVSTGRMSWPLKGRLVSRFGYRRHPIWGGMHLHSGIDIAAPHGKPISASDSGEVIFSGWWDGYGKALVIDHGRGYTTVYGHMSRIYLQAGQSVEKGQMIGLVGSTGYSTGPHLHFEVRQNGRPVDPLAYL